MTKDQVPRKTASRTDLRIRHLLLLTLSTLSLIAISFIAWNANQARIQYNEASLRDSANSASLQALTLNTLLARERGLTSILLANPSLYQNRSREHLAAIRANVDSAMQLLTRKLQGPGAQAQLASIPKKLASQRQQVDESLSGQRQALSYQEWMIGINQRIEDIAAINRAIMMPVNNTSGAAYYGAHIKEAFFKLSENAGKERALIGAVVAQNRSFVSDEYLELDRHQAIMESAEQQIREILAFFPPTQELSLVSEGLTQNANDEYRHLKRKVIKSSIAERDYPVSAIEWFEQATDNINYMLNLAQAVDHHITEEILSVKRKAQYTVLALFALLVGTLAVFIGALVIVYRRILVPLRKLERSAHTIAKGDFSSVIQVVTNDELGEVSVAFETMRSYLSTDRQQRQNAEDELRKLTAALEHSASAVIIANTKGIVEYVNPQFSLTTGYPANEVIGKSANLLKSGKTPPATYTDLWLTIRQGKVWDGELRNKKKNGDLYWDNVSISPVRGRNGDITHYISVQHDISEGKHLKERLQFMAYHDDLTSLPNRYFLEEEFKTRSLYHDQAQSQMALMIVDLDNFKMVIDSLGRRIGDQVIITVAQRLRHALPSNQTIAHYGGDEFVMLVSDYGDTDALTQLAEDLLAVVTQPMTIEDHELHISASMGISVRHDDSEDLGAMLRKADAAMHDSMGRGRGQFQFYADELNQKVLRRLRMESDLRKAIEREEFELYYQPQVNLASGDMTGVEALIRWNHPELGMVPPNDFISIAEDAHLIKAIGKWVIETACGQLADWTARGYAPISMAVNVSVHQLESAKFNSCLANILQQSGIDPDLLEIEITESAVMSQPKKMLDVLNDTKRLGVRLALDDFGTGYSSLSYLRRFPFDKLKIDRSFIKDIIDNQQDAAIAKAIIDMAHSLEMSVLAEGVETDIQCDFMRHFECDEIQGYLISRPVSAHELEKRLSLSVKALPLQA